MDHGTPQVDAAYPTNVSVGVEPLSEGLYSIPWRALSTVDGHVTQGAFSFAVGEGLAPGQALLPSKTTGSAYPLIRALARWPVFVGALAVVGGTLFRFLVFGRGPGPPEARAAAGRHWSRLRWWSVVVLLTSHVAALWVQVAQVTGQPWDLSGFPMVVGMRWGRIWLVRTALITGLIGVTALLGTTVAPRSRRHWCLETMGLLLGLGVLASLSLVSHSAASSLPGLGVPNDVLHLLAASAWVGGLFCFLVVGLPTSCALAPQEQRRFLAGLARRFTPLALVSAGLLWATGALASWLRIGTLGALFGTPYGLTLLAKLALVALTSVGGAINFVSTRPRLEAAEALPQAAQAPRLLGRVLRLEALAAASALLTVGALTWLTPGREVWALRPQPLTLEQREEDLQVRLEIQPAGIGPNVYLVALQDRSGPVLQAEVELRFEYLEWDFTPRPIKLAGVGNGRYREAGDHLSLQGWWKVAVLVRRPGAFDARVAFHFALPARTAGDPRAHLPRLRHLAGWDSLGALMVATLGSLLGAIGWQGRRLTARARRAVLATGLTLFVGAVIVLARAHIVADSPLEVAAYRDVLNPVLPDRASILAGRALYDSQCASCHGPSPTFAGDGPQAADLLPPPSDLRIHLPLHRDGELFAFIAHGLPNTAMRPYQEVLSIEDIWHLVNYLQAVATPHH
jgi:copper transport protein